MRVPLALLAGGLAWILWHPTRIHHDPAMFLSMGSRLLQGAVPYVDMIELNPPLVVYLHAVPAAIARATGMYLPLTFLVIVWVFAVWSAFMTLRVMRAGSGPPLRAIATAASLAIFSLVVLHRIDFGQREHLFAIALVPYLLLRCRREAGETPVSTAAACALGCVTAVLACVKPHLVAIALAPEIYWLARRRRLRVPPELAAFILIGIAYGVHFLLLPSGMRQALFDRWVPLVADGYRVYDEPMDVAILHWRRWVPGAIAGLLLPVAARTGTQLRPFAVPVVIVTLAGTVSYLAQHKGWPHHAMPVEIMFYVVTGLVAGNYLQRRLDEPQSLGIVRLANIAATVMLIVFGGAVAYLTARPRIATELAALSASHPLARAIETHSQPGEPVLVISTSVPPAYPLLTLLDRQAGSRYEWEFMLPMLYRDTRAREGEPFPYQLHEPWRVAEEARVRAELAEDIRVRRPALVIVAAECQGCPAGFSLRDYLQWARFAQTALAGYEPLAPVDGMQLFLRR